MKKCRVCRLAFFDQDYPYLVPVNFGVKAERGEISLYIHGAGTGKKMDLLRKNNHVAFSMDTGEELRRGESPCQTTMTYESVCGNGQLVRVEGEEKEMGLRLLMVQLGGEAGVFSPPVLARTAVLRLRVHQVWGKRNE